MKVFVATPAYDGRVTTAFTVAMIRSFSLMAHAGIGAKWESLDGCCYLPVARNKLVRSFLASDATDLFFVDSDVGWDADAFLRVLQYDRAFVGGVVPFKMDKEGYPVNVKLDDKRLPVKDPETGLLDTIMLATAFMRIKREVFETIHAVHGDKLLVIERNADGSESERYLNFFDCQHVGDRWWGEDARFCKLWTNAGGKIWVDPDIDFVHTGGKSWEGNFGRCLEQTRRLSPEDRPQPVMEAAE